jgi:hypothetical protein
LTRGCHFIETRGVEFRLYPVENRAGPWIINPVQYSTALKHVIFTSLIYSIKNLNFIPGFTLLFIYFAFDYLSHKIPKSIDRSFPQQGLVFRIVEN